MLTTSIVIDGLGTVYYMESFWTGKKQLYINGDFAEKISKNSYMYAGKTLVLKGNYTFGLRIICDGVEYSPSNKAGSKLSWYEYVLAVLPLVFILVWGNSVALNGIFPLIGGAVGGAYGGLIMGLQCVILRKIGNNALKVAASIAISVASIALLSFLSALLISSLL